MIRTVAVVAAAVFVLYRLQSINTTVSSLNDKIDKLAALAKANGVDAAAVDAIKNRANL